MATLYLLLRRSGLILWLAVVVGLMSGAGNTALLAMLHAAVTGGKTSQRWSTPGLFFALCIVISFTRVLAQYLMDRLGQGAVFDLRMRLSDKVLATPLRQLEVIGAAPLLTVLTNDIAAVAGSIVILPIICINAALVIGCLGYLATLSLPLFWILLVLIVVGSATYRLPVVLGERRFAVVRRLQESLFESFRGIVHGNKELKGNSARRRAFLSSLERTADAQRHVQITANLIYGAAAAWGHLLFFVVIGVLVFARPRLETVPNAALIGYTLVLLYLMTPLQALLGVLGQLGTSNAALRRIGELGLSLAGGPAGDLGSPVPAPARSWSRLRLAGVTHRYTDGTDHGSFALGPLELQIRGGELIFITGGNGSGKTTLAKLLAGLYTPEEGCIYVDDEPVVEETLETYRHGFSAVFQDFYLFPDLHASVTGEGALRPQDLLRQLELDAVIRIEDGRLSTIEVSRGQQKRLALLHAYLEDRPVYLFDEWAADQDPIFKQIFYSQILAELKRRGKTILVITHDDQYYDLADRIIKLEHGRVRFDGTAQAFFQGTPSRALGGTGVASPPPEVRRRAPS